MKVLDKDVKVLEQRCEGIRPRCEGVRRYGKVCPKHAAKVRHIQGIKCLVHTAMTGQGCIY